MTFSLEDVERIARLFKFYNVTTINGLIAAQELHIEKLQQRDHMQKQAGLQGSFGIVGEAHNQIRQG